MINVAFMIGGIHRQMIFVELLSSFFDILADGLSDLFICLSVRTRCVLANLFSSPSTLAATALARLLASLRDVVRRV